MESNCKELLVSVLMCVYNEESQFLKDAIESILNQTFKDFEFIIIGDNPTNDRVNNIIRSYQEKDDRIKFKINETNIGLTRSLNVGLQLCRGKYIVRMDADDMSLPDRIAEQVAFMEAHPAITAAGSNAYGIDENNDPIGDVVVLQDPDVIKRELLFRCPVVHPSTIIRRMWQNKPFVYNESFRYSQDYALWVSIFAMGGQVSNLNKYLLKYRYSSKQIHSAHGDEQRECAIRISHNALEMIGIQIAQDDLSKWDKIRGSQTILNNQIKEFFNFIIRFYSNNTPIQNIGIIVQTLIITFLQKAGMRGLIFFKSYLYLSVKTKSLTIKRVLSTSHLIINGISK